MTNIMAGIKKRVVFTFNERSLQQLENFKEQGRFETLGEAVGASLQISGSLQKQKLNGYSEVVVRNPDSKEERVLVIPQL